MTRTPARSLLVAALLAAHASFALAAPASNDRAVQVRRISITDWLAAQTTSVVGMQGRESSKPNSPLGQIVYIDYAGTNVASKGLSYGFAATGGATVRTLPDGSGEVLVDLSFANAVTEAYDKDLNLIFGYWVTALKTTAATPALSNGHIQAKYTVPDADAADLNLVDVTFLGGGTLTQIKFHSSGQGVCHAALGVPEGTPGICIADDNGIFNTSGGGATNDLYPLEHVDVRPLGNAVVTASSSSSTGLSPQAPAPTHRSATTWGRVKALYR